jgi:hypothetical protein
VSPSRPKLARVSEETKEWCSLLGAEMSSWPAVTSRPMFGMTVFYRRSVVFAVLPRTRGFGAASSIGFKLYRKTPEIRKRLAADPRIIRSSEESAKWIPLEVSDEKDLKNALKWLDLAYRSTRSRGAEDST